ncbi:glycogen debranching protein [Fulvivirga sedimenti]|uniref:Glycogen debranching protein n=1 Tax=Fulvivirga sedimenti TaxID=2879465 RepID=A0A9X1HWE9_9BACT|nr:glycogen debranching protein [Fulvivirga sedimenti]MCA6079086.1 glycogen debranching protein [Fulvivirga sedimenti]
MTNNSEFIAGNASYLHSPYVTPGNRAYMVGHQDGSFPDLGWHVTGEMGGIWMHPLKLMDGFSAALISGNQTLCLAEADTFINYPFANKHVYNNPFGIRVERFQFVPENTPGVILEYGFHNPTNQSIELLFEFNGMTDIRPVWLGEQTGLKDSPDQIFWESRRQAFIAKDSLNPWYVMFGSPSKHLRYDLKGTTCLFDRRGTGTNGSITWIINVPANGQAYLPIFIAGSDKSQAQAESVYGEMHSTAAELLRKKINHYEEIAELTSLTLPDKEMERAFRWTKYNTEWLRQTVPDVGSGLTAGIPDYPWWFGADSEYALQGAIMTGRTDLVYETIDLIHSISEKVNGNGRVVHEVSSNGAVFNPGNINETPQFTSLVWTIYRWTGDRTFLEKYYPFVKEGLAWLLTTDVDGNMLPDGFGMMEIHGLDSEMIDVAAYSHKAFADAAKMAAALGYADDEKDFKLKAERLAGIINNEFWVDDFNSFADFVGTPEQALSLIDDAIHRADSLGKPWAVGELEATREQIRTLPKNSKQGFVLHHNWVVNTPMETGVADPEKAIRALETGSKFVNPFGVFVTGIDRDESAGDEEGSFQTNKKIFSYIGAVMTLPTGVQAVAENNYARPDQALNYLERMTKTFSYALPGSMYEVSPDYGMIVQAWNIYSFAVPVVSQFFGIKPDAYEQKLDFSPQMPLAWNKAALGQVHMGSNSMDFEFERKGKTEIWNIRSAEIWNIQLTLPSDVYTQVLINGEPISAIENNTDTFTFEVGTTEQIVLELKAK